MRLPSKILAAGLILAASAAAQAADRAIIVLDASGSMWGQIAGVAKIGIARETLVNVLGSVPPDIELGLMAYGHRDKGSCNDIELIVPPAAGTIPAIAEAANALVPKGKTPISAAVTQAAHSLLYTEEKATVILITDGLETCEADPCATASALEAAGIDFTAHVVGFGLSEEEGRQVACLAENTGGKYFSANNATDLGTALATTVAQVSEPAPAPEPVPAPAPALDHNLAVTAQLSDNVPLMADDGSIRFDVFPVTDGVRAENPTETGYGGGMPAKFNLPAGTYAIVASRELASGETEATIADGLTKATINMNAGILVARAMATENDPVANGDAVRWDTTSGNRTDTSYGPVRTILVPAGDATVQASLGSAVASVPVTIVAGETTDVDVVVGAGTLKLRGKRSAEANDTDDAIRWDISSPTIDTVTTYGGEISVELPGGDYTVKATLGEASAEAQVSVAAGKTTEAEIVVATVRIRAHAVFAEGGPIVKSPRFDVMAGEAGADGEHRVIATSYEDGVTFDVPPGSYILRASSDIATADLPFDLKAGPPVDVTVVLNAGLLAITAPGGDRLDLLGVEKDIYGEQAVLATNYGESWQLAVPAGAYAVKVRKTDGSEVTGTATVAAGKRAEVTVE